MYKESFIRHISKLPASLKDGIARMNDRIKNKQVTGQMNHQTADPKANASIFFIFSQRSFFKNNFSHQKNGTFGFSRHTSQRSDTIPTEKRILTRLKHKI
jgi:hypothetical protein